MPTTDELRREATATVREVLRHRPQRGMKYDSQVVWILDPLDAETTRNGNRLHGKRCAIGQGDNSAIVCGESVTWPAALPKSGNSRLYVVGHGVPLGDARGQVIGFKISSESGRNLDAQALASKIGSLLGGTKIKRIGLVMCYGGGWKAENIGPERSFAFQLAEHCVGLTEDITARVDEMFVQAATLPRADTDKAAGVSEKLAPHMQALHRMKNARDQDVSVLTATKRVAGFQPHQPGSVIVVKPNAANPKVPQYEFRREWSGA